MASYVTSLDGNARLAHIGHPVTACGVTFVGPHRTSNDMPADRAICSECVSSALGFGWITADEADALARHQPEITDHLMPMLIEGRSDREIMLRLGVSGRTLSRRIADAMKAARARTRFQWGYIVGFAAASD